MNERALDPLVLRIEDLRARVSVRRRALIVITGIDCAGTIYVIEYALR